MRTSDKKVYIVVDPEGRPLEAYDSLDAAYANAEAWRAATHRNHSVNTIPYTEVLVNAD